MLLFDIITIDRVTGWIPVPTGTIPKGMTWTWLIPVDSRLPVIPLGELTERRQ